MEPTVHSHEQQFTPTSLPPVMTAQHEAPVESITPSIPKQTDLQPMPVVKVLSPVGVEYVFLTLTLLVGAGSLVAVLLTIVNSATSFASLSFPVSSLLVTLPLFAVIFLHLKKMELQNPALRFDPSKRRSTQFTQIFSFLITLFTVIGFVFSALAHVGGQSGTSVGKAALDALCVGVVSGGILWYYWRDEHKMVR